MTTNDYRDFYSRYRRFLPDLSKIKSLDLSWDHGMNHADEGCKFGLQYHYSVNHTGHIYVVACVIPTLPPDMYPIAYFHEEEPVADIFASSITTWLPCY